MALTLLKQLAKAIEAETFAYAHWSDAEQGWPSGITKAAIAKKKAKFKAAEKKRQAIEDRIKKGLSTQVESKRLEQEKKQMYSLARWW